MSRAPADVHLTAQAWAAPRGTTLVQLRPTRGVWIVAITGRLDTAAVQPCRAALDVAVEHHRPIIVDLRRAAPPGSVGVALLAAMRRYATNRGAAMAITEVCEPWAIALQTAGSDSCTRPCQA